MEENSIEELKAQLIREQEQLNKSFTILLRAVDEQGDTAKTHVEHTLVIIGKLVGMAVSSYLLQSGVLPRRSHGVPG